MRGRMGFRPFSIATWEKRAGVFILCACLGFGFAGFADTSPTKSSSRVGEKRCAFSLLSAALLFGALAGGPPAAVEMSGRLSDTPHIGMGIYFDWNNVESLFTSKLRAKIADPRSDRYEVIRDISQEISFSFKDELEPLPIINPRMASEYLRHDFPVAQTCRHKALILSAVLNEMGIENQVRWGDVRFDKGEKGPSDPGHAGIHVWVYIPEFDLVADPTQGYVMPKEEYYTKFVLKERKIGFSAYSKTFGLFLR